MKDDTDMALLQNSGAEDSHRKSVRLGGADDQALYARQV